jgi:protein-S-isoprenylcysteine O-methyltransferase Ste14
VILVGFGLALVLSLLLFALQIGGFLPPFLIEIGIAVSLTGVVVRCWAITSLGRFFSPVIRIESDHQIVRIGPYRWLRHPSYTGALFASLGAAIALGTIAGSLLTAAIGLIVFGYRIRLEEQMLIDRFGDEYREYIRTTWRLLPGIY